MALLKRLSFCLLLAFSGTVASLGNSPSVTADAASEFAAPALWHLKHETSELYIFGTMHLLTPDTQWQTTQMTAALARATRLVLEVPPADLRPLRAAAAVQQYGFLPAGKTLRDALPPRLSGPLLETLAANGIPGSAADRMKPWLATMTFSQIMISKAGYGTEEGVELSLLRMVEGRALPVIGLESIELQFKLMDRVPEHVWTDVVALSLKQAQDLEAVLDELKRSWLEADLEALAAVFEEDSSGIAGYREILLDQRNANWPDQIDDLMKKPGIYFLAVGAGHLVGPNNLIQLLEEKGYRPVRQ